MSKLAVGRDTPLTPAEIAEALLRQSDVRPRNPSIRGLAAELGTSPMAIYHHFDSLAAIYQAAVGIVWREASATTIELLSANREADATETLVLIGIATRRTWLRHHRLVQHMSATPQPNEFTTSTLDLMAGLFAELGLSGEEAAAAFHAYASFMIGAAIFAANRKTANEALAVSGKRPVGSQQLRRTQASARLSIDSVMELSEIDPARDEELFVAGLRRLIASLSADVH
jgi:AcrR family transcriptional regulator